MRSLPLNITKRLTRLDLVVDVVDHLPISRSLWSINPALQTGSTSALGHTYYVDEDVISPFQRAADIVDPSSESQQHDVLVVVEEKFLQGFAKATTGQGGREDGGYGLGQGGAAT